MKQASTNHVTAKYAALGRGGSLSNGKIYRWIVHDSDDGEVSDLDAHVRSGDYFSVLATQLDSLTEKLPPNSDEVSRIEGLVRDLLYIDQKYRIVSIKLLPNTEH